MPQYPYLTETNSYLQMIDRFKGYNHNLKIGDGEFYTMQNLTSDDYPLLSSRPKRGQLTALEAPHGLLGKSKLAYIDGTSLWYGDQDLSGYLRGAGFALREGTGMLPKQLISMGAYLIIYPDKLYINTENYTDCGSVDAWFSTGTLAEGQGVRYSLCKADGSAYGAAMLSAAAPADPADGALWIDTSGSAHALKQYSAQSAVWVELAAVYTKIEYAGIGKQFSKLDGVTIAGCAADGEFGAANQIEALNGSHILYDKGDDYLVVAGLLDQAYTQVSGTVTVSRSMPDLDFITESENRLWGCKYGLVNGRTVNEIYCCALGDFKNWNQFLGVATDSYVASVGTDGPWTGAVTHLGYPIFFKENCLHKVYISASGAHQIVDTTCRGVQKGSHNSLAVVNEQLYYKAVTDVMMYDGSLPVSVSGQLGTERYFSAVAGSMGEKYYISMADQRGAWHLFVYDTARGLWHREDDTQARFFARCGGELYCIDSSNRLLCISGNEGTPEEEISWSAETGLMGYNAVHKKYISRFNLRMQLPKGSQMDVYVEYDSEGCWQHQGHITGTGTKTFTVPVRPRRCDHFRIRLTGSGPVKIYSFGKIYEVGSDV